MDIHQLYREANEKLVVVSSFMEKYSLKGFDWIDHIGYDCDSSVVFEEMRRMLEKESNYFIQSVISGRRSGYFCLNRSFDTSCGGVKYLELADQKPDRSQKNGFDHVEIYPGRRREVHHVLVELRDKGVSIFENLKPHHKTYDILLDGIKLKISQQPLIEKIVETRIGLPLKIPS